MSNIPSPYNQLAGFIQGTYDDSQIRQAIAIYELLSNSSGSIPISIGTPLTPSVKTPTYFMTSSAGTIAAGSISVAIANIGNTSGQLLGNILPPNTSVNWDAPIGSKLSSIAYDATGTTFSISTLS